MTQPTSPRRHRSAIGAYVALYTVALGVLGLVARPVARVARRARRDEAGFSEIAQNIAMASIGVLLIIAAYVLFKPVVSAIINKIQTDVLGQT